VRLPADTDSLDMSIAEAAYAQEEAEAVSVDESGHRETAGGGCNAGMANLAAAALALLPLLLLRKR
jgi:Synergist-CTERM protein sorting domain-containing protein